MVCSSVGGFCACRWKSVEVPSFAGRACLCVHYVHLPESKHEYYWDLSRLLRSVCLMDIVVVGSYFSARIDSLEKTERHIGDPFSLSPSRTENVDRLIQAYSYKRFFCRNRTPVIESDTGSVGTLLQLHAVELRLTTLL